MSLVLLFFFNDTATTEIYTLSLHDALPISLVTHDPPPPKAADALPGVVDRARPPRNSGTDRSEEHTSELQSLAYLVCRLLLEKKKNKTKRSCSRCHGTSARRVRSAQPRKTA